jgi:hypothetical protein
MEVVYINIREGYFNTIYELLKQIPDQRVCFPTLRQISIRFAEHDTPENTTTNIGPLRKKIEAVGIKLDLIEMTNLEMQEALNISIDQHQSMEGMRWFFDMTRI